MGVGYTLYLVCSPSEEQMERVLRESGRMDTAQMNRQKELGKLQIKAILENAKSDRPIWDVKW